MALSQKEYSERFYRKRKENGLCPRCGKKLDRYGHYCTECLEKIRIYHEENKKFFRENGLCPQCGKNKLFGDEKSCPECLARQNAYRAKHPLSDEKRAEKNEKFRNYSKALYEERKKAGVCTRCGKRNAAFDRAKCQMCLDKDAYAHRKVYFEKPNIIEYRIENHLCYYCGQPIDRKSGKICQKCCEKRKENGRKSVASKNHYWRKDNRLLKNRRNDK